MAENNEYKKSVLFYPELSYTLYGLFFETHNELGRYCNEQQYADYLETLFQKKHLRYMRESPLIKSFEGEQPRRNIPDFIFENTIVVDLKAKRLITREDYFQMKRYLASSQKKLGIIVNFHQKILTPKRILNSII